MDFEIKLKDGVTEEEAQRKMEICFLNDLLNKGAIDKALYDKLVMHIEKSKTFDKLDAEERESSLMFSAMRCYEIFEDIPYSNCDDAKYSEFTEDSIEMLRQFSKWAREFEIEYHGSAKYITDYIGLTDTYFKEKLLLKLN